MKLVSRKELSKVLGIGVQTLTKYEKAGYITPKIKLNFKTARYDLDDVIRKLSELSHG